MSQETEEAKKNESHDKSKENQFATNKGKLQKTIINIGRFRILKIMSYKQVLCVKYNTSFLVKVLVQV